MRRRLVRPGSAVLSALATLIAAGCAPGRRAGSYLPAGARAWYGDDTNDGVVVLLRGEADAVTRGVERAFRAAGYVVKPRAASGRAARTVRTAPRALGGDTTLVVTAEVTPYEAPAAAASVVLTGTYDVPGRGLSRAPVLQRRGEVSALYARLRAVADTLRVEARSAQ